MSKYNLTDIYEGISPNEAEKIKLMQLFKQGKIDTLPDVDSDEYKSQKIRAMLDKEKSMEENYQMDGETYSRIDGLVDQPLLKLFLDTFVKINNDLIANGENFDVDDLVDFLTIQLDKKSKELQEGKEVNEGDPIVDETEFDFFKTFFGIGSEDVIPNTNATDEEIEAYLKSDDYQEELQHSELDEKDIGNWVNSFLYWRDKNNLKEYFNRFKQLKRKLKKMAYLFGYAIFYSYIYHVIKNKGYAR